MTQRARFRPYGVETILAGIDDERGPVLYKMDPSGHFSGYRAVAAGVKEQVYNYFIKGSHQLPWKKLQKEVSWIIPFLWGDNYSCNSNSLECKYIA